MMNFYPDLKVVKTFMLPVFDDDGCTYVDEVVLEIPYTGKTMTGLNMLRTIFDYYSTLYDAQCGEK